MTERSGTAIAMSAAAGIAVADSPRVVAALITDRHQVTGISATRLVAGTRNHRNRGRNKTRKAP